MQSEVVIVGGGGFGREVRDWILQWNQANPSDVARIIGFLDDGAPDTVLLDKTNSIHLGTIDQYPRFHAEFVVAVGDTLARRNLAERCSRMGGAPFTAIVHPSVSLGSVVGIGAGSIIAPHSVITTNVQIGSHVRVDIGVTISHDCIVGDYSSISPGAHLSGGVILGDEVFVGIGASILPGVFIGNGATVGAGAVVTKDVAPRDVVVGVPARSIRVF